MRRLGAVFGTALAAGALTVGLAVPAAASPTSPTAPTAPTAVSADAGSSGPDGCATTDHPTTARYASGAECAPTGFGYTPTVKQTKAGPRATDPYTNYCSKSPDTGPTFNFKNACATHDYLADLLRAGAPGLTEPAIDHQLYQDALADCRKRNAIAKASCVATAAVYRGFVQEGDYNEGDDIDGVN